MSFKIEGTGTSIYDEKNEKLKLIIPELKQTGTNTQTSTQITKTLSGSVEESTPKTNSWEINETFDNYTMTFVSHKAK